VKTINPFTPTVSLMSVPQRSRRERFKVTMFSVLAAHAILLIGLLIQGCKSESGLSAASTQDSTNSPALQAERPVATTQKPAVKPAAFSGSLPATVPAAPQPAHIAMPQPASVPVKQIAATTAASTETIYTVKSGDTLSRIAKTHATTISALKTANGLTSDRLSIGTKLKIPANSGPQAKGV
jgi:LysM repeat protein